MISIRLLKQKQNSRHSENSDEDEKYQTFNDQAKIDSEFYRKKSQAFEVGSPKTSDKYKDYVGTPVISPAPLDNDHQDLDSQYWKKNDTDHLLSYC